jgi:RNA polymerase subunit RPABC4/transcription elongation factor Spt4
MKCSVCSKEFGTGTHCQHCGVDRVTGLANYSGFDNHSRSTNHHYTDNAGQSSNNITACYSCGEIIPSDAEYCPYCRKKLYEECPKCGKTYSSQFDNCPKCGTNRVQYYNKLKAEEEEEKRRERKREEESKLKNEAYKLRNQLDEDLYQKKYFLIGAFGGFTGLLVGLQIIDKNDPGLFPGLLVSFCLGFLAFWYPIRIYVDFKGKDNIEKWKEQHLNDPRRNYL